MLDIRETSTHPMEKREAIGLNWGNENMRVFSLSFFPHCFRIQQVFLPQVENKNSFCIQHCFYFFLKMLINLAN